MAPTSDSVAAATSDAATTPWADLFGSAQPFWRRVYLSQLVRRCCDVLSSSLSSLSLAAAALSLQPSSLPSYLIFVLRTLILSEQCELVL